MKILYIANIRFPTERAHGVQIAKMCEAFADAGSIVTLVVPNRMAQISEDSYQYYSVRPNFEIAKLGELENPQSSIGYWIAYMKFTLRLPWYCRRNKADVYYSRDASIVFILSLFGIKAVWETHGWKGGFLVRYLLNKIEKVIVITHIAKKRFVEGGIPEQKICVAPDGIDESLLAADREKTSARTKLGLPAQGTFAFYIGSLNKWKGYQTLLQCADALASRHITIVIVGSVTEKQKRESPKVVFLGFIPYKELATVQAAADMLVIPNSAASIVSTDYTSPLKLFAHMASGRPIIASDLPSLREILDEGTAYFSEPDNPESLTHVIEYVSAHPEEAAEKAQKALIKVREYTWEKRAKSILTFIQQ